MNSSIRLVSICIPAYNAAKYIRETLESIYKQNFRDWELIVVEDGSNDGTQGLVKSFSESVSNSVKYLRHDHNQGLPATRNTGIAAAQGHYIALLDADDIWAPKHLEGLLGAANDEIKMVHSVSLLFHGSPQQVFQKRIPAKDCPIIESLFDGRTIIQPSSVLIHKEILRKVGPFDEQFRNGLGEDIDYWLRIASAGYPIECNDEETCFYRKHVNSISSKGAKLTVGTARVRQKHLYAPAFNQTKRNTITANYLAAAARMHLRAEPETAKNLYQDSIKLVPTRLDRVLLYMLSWILSKA